MLLQKSHCFQLLTAFKTLDISQGSVATHLRCGEIFIDRVAGEINTFGNVLVCACVCVRPFVCGCFPV